ncbi:MAG: DUF389 domain-containing protein [Enterococcus sp.]
MEQTTGMYDSVEFQKKINDDLRVKKSDSVILMCAILIASIGLNMNSIPIIIGSMLISPLMMPIISIGFGLAITDKKILLKAIRLLALELLVSLTVATLYFLISPITYASTEIIARTSPTIWDVVIAFAGGLAGIIGARKKESNNIVPGVAIATALMPPVCTIGYAISTLNWDYFMGASYLFIINCTFIILATFIGTQFMRYPYQKIKSPENKKMNRLLLIIAILILIPSISSATLLVQESMTKTSINTMITNELADYTVLKQTYTSKNNSLDLVVSGKHLTTDEKEELNKKLPKYGLENLTISFEQVPNLNELTGEEATKYIEQYIQEKLDTTNDVELNDHSSND